MHKKDKFSLSSKGLRYKLKIAFYLMLILPLLIFLYFISNYILPQRGLEINIAILFLVCSFIGISGFWVIRDVIRRIVSVSSEAKLIAAGDINHQIERTQPDEVGDLGDSINLITQQIRDNMEELKDYSTKTSEFNLEIQRRVVLLSSLLQITSMVSQGNKLDDILMLAVEKSRQIVDSDSAYLLLKDEEKEILKMNAADGVNAQDLLNIRLDIEKSIFDNCIKRRTALILDSENPVSGNLYTEFYETFKLKATLAIPMYSKGRLLGVLGIGQIAPNFVYKKDTQGFLNIFAKNIAIAIESDILKRRVEKLEIKDTLTGLYNDTFIRSRLQEEIKRALVYQRPCSFILFKIDDFRRIYDNLGIRFSEMILKKVATLIQASVTEIDRVARFAGDEFAVVLPERNKRQAIEIAEKVRKKIEFSFSEEEKNRRITVSGSLSENPLDGVTASELIQKAKDLLIKAKDSGKIVSK